MDFFVINHNNGKKRKKTVCGMKEREEGENYFHSLFSVILFICPSLFISRTDLAALCDELGLEESVDTLLCQLGADSSGRISCQEFIHCRSAVIRAETTIPTTTSVDHSKTSFSSSPPRRSGNFLDQMNINGDANNAGSAATTASRNNQEVSSNSNSSSKGELVNLHENCLEIKYPKECEIRASKSVD